MTRMSRIFERAEREALRQQELEKVAEENRQKAEKQAAKEAFIQEAISVGFTRSQADFMYGKFAPIDHVHHQFLRIPRIRLHKTSR